MSQYLLNIDSTYRDRKIYPFSTEFGVMVNPTPGDNASGNVYLVDNIIYSQFRWSGTSTTTVPDDTITGNFVDFSSSTIVLDPAHAQPVLNYYLGCVFVITGGFSSVIDFYDNVSNKIHLENPLPAPINTQYSIVNPSYVYPNEMLLLGSNLYVNLSNDNILNRYFLKSGPTNLLFVQNVSKGWVLPINKVLQKFKLITFNEDIPSYSNGDLFQIRENAQILAYTTVGASAIASIREYEVTRLGDGYSIGDTVVISSGGTAVFIVSRVDGDGGIMALRLVSPGSDYQPGFYQIVAGSNTSATLAVYSVSASVGVNESPFPRGQYILFVPSIVPLATSFFSVISIEENFIFFQNPNELSIGNDESIELMTYRNYSTGLTMPLVSYNQSVCYEVSLVHLIIPNQPVYGYNVLPTFFPYIMVELYNVSSPGSNAGIIYTNNPNTEKVSFYCPIGNPKNPLIVSYLIISSTSQIQLLKWTPLDNFFFRVLLPNGETLQYNFDLDVNEMDIINGNIASIATSEFHFWGQLTDRRVSATFSFRLR